MTPERRADEGNLKSVARSLFLSIMIRMIVVNLIGSTRCLVLTSIPSGIRGREAARAMAQAISLSRRRTVGKTGQSNRQRQAVLRSPGWR
jgi:hypothetical protein